ncbi:MAG: cytochrome c biogenesis protein CcsA [Pseudomonadales bacterium]|nr:cytochrome c biogenesis protein CcsA [Pseudomonadales bacterium]
MASTLPGFAIVAGVVAMALYALTAALMVRDLRRMRHGPFGLIMTTALPAVLLHALVTWLQINQPQGFYLGFFAAASLVAVVMTAFVLASAVRLPVQNLLLLVLPISILSLIGSLTGETTFAPRQSLGPALLAHILVSVTAYSILFMAACQALLLGYQEHVLRGKRSLGMLRMLPPLETMESFLFTLLWAGVAGLTLAIASGFAFLEDMFAQHVVHHTVLTIVSWLLYAALLTGHYVFGWRSYTATYGTLIAFALLLLGYFGSKLVIEVILGR